MIFNSLIYFAVFLLPTALLYQKRPAASRPWLLSVVGALFFIFFSITTVGGVPGAFCLLLILWQSLCCLYLCKPGSKLCYFVIIQSILILCAFKYLNFFGGLIFGSPEKSPLYWRDVFLPLGISFFTFEFIHYAVDRFKGKAEQASMGDFLAFILFFPTMVAGPIKRIQDFAPKLHTPDTDIALNFNRGITRILTGLVKKFAIADLLSAATDHLNQTDIQNASGRAVLLFWLFAYGWKIYFDFSAYSDIAIGSARLMGIRVPENFDGPYLQKNIAEFWQHWHISLYRWLVDYVFIPLGGSRVSPVMVYRNVIAVMLVSGIWHGAGTNFIIWGAWHALLLCIHRLWNKMRKSGGDKEPPAPNLALDCLSWVLTYVAVNLGWAFFAMNAPTAMLFFRRLFLG
jgi:alginate O-acetyltransferase complex protein AlgI